MELALKQQSEEGEEIQRIITNFKKNPNDRKTFEYCQQRLIKLQQLMETFKARLQEILAASEYQEWLGHPYVMNEYYISTLVLVEQYIKILHEACEGKTKQAQTSKANTQQGATEQPSAPPLIRRQHAQLEALERQIQILRETPNHAQANVFERLWDEIQHSHYQIFETIDKPAQAGYNQEKYIRLESWVLQLMANNTDPGQSTMIGEQQSITTSTPAIALPKQTISKFDGDFLKWKQFFDIFSQMVD